MQSAHYLSEKAKINDIASHKPCSLWLLLRRSVIVTLCLCCGLHHGNTEYDQWWFEEGMGAKRPLQTATHCQKCTFQAVRGAEGHSRSWVGAGHPWVPPRIRPLGASPRLCPHQARSGGWAGRQSSSFRSPANKKIFSSSRERKWRASEAAVQSLKSVEWVFGLFF